MEANDKVVVNLATELEDPQAWRTTALGGRSASEFGAGRPALRLGVLPDVPVPIALAAPSSASIRLAGQLADEWAPFLWARSRVHEGRALLEEGESRARPARRSRLGLPPAPTVSTSFFHPADPKTNSSKS